MRKKDKRFAYKDAVIIIIAFVLSAGGIYSLIMNYYEIYKLNKYKSNLESENNVLRERISLANSRDFIEYTARVKLGFKKPDEIEYRFTPPFKK